MTRQVLLNALKSVSKRLSSDKFVIVFMAAVLPGLITFSIEIAKDISHRATERTREAHALRFIDVKLRESSETHGYLQCMYFPHDEDDKRAKADSDKCLEEARARAAKEVDQKPKEETGSEPASSRLIGAYITVRKNECPLSTTGIAAEETHCVPRERVKTFLAKIKFLEKTDQEIQDKLSTYIPCALGYSDDLKANAVQFFEHFPSFKETVEILDTVDFAPENSIPNFPRSIRWQIRYEKNRRSFWHPSSWDYEYLGCS